MEPTHETPRPPAAKPSSTSWPDRVKELGPLGLVVLFSTLVVSMLFFGTALHFGLGAQVPWLAEHLPAGATTVVGAYALSKLITVPRIILTVAITPWIAALRRGRTEAATIESDPKAP